jgi:rubrerythrin
MSPRERKKGCTGKVRYATYGQALTMATMLMNTVPSLEAAGVYVCKHCGGYHVTGHPRPHCPRNVALLTRDEG